MIYINGIEINSTIKFEIKNKREYYYQEETLDGVVHSKYKKTRKSYSLSFAPKTTQATNDLLGLLESNYDKLTIKYPSTEAGFWYNIVVIIDSYDYEVSKIKNNENDEITYTAISAINVDCEEI